MNAQRNSPSLILIYHDFRGMAQTIRYILCYLNIPFHEVLLEQGQSISSLEIIRERKLPEDIDLPCLIHGEHVIQDTFAIIRYLCTKALREDLLGQTIEQKTLIREIYYNFLLKKKKEIKLFFRFGQKAAQFPLKKQQMRKMVMQQSHQSSGSLIPTLKLKLKSQNQRYIFGHITALDFLFYEECFYQVNLFANLQEKNCAVLTTINSIFKTDLYNYKDQNSVYLKVMREFKESFENQFFYVQNKEKLNSYGLFCPIMKDITKECFKKVWLGPQNLLK